MFALVILASSSEFYILIEVPLHVDPSTDFFVPQR